MKFSKLYIDAMVFGLIGAVGGAFAGGFTAAATCEGGLECLGTAFLGVGLGVILMKSGAMSLAVHKANQRRGNLLLTFLPTVVLAVPTPIVLLPGLTAPLAAPLFLLQAWVRVKVQVATCARKRPVRRSRPGSR